MQNDNREPFEILEALLHAENTPDDWMNVCELDGFLAALAVGPVAVDESEWLPIVFGLTPLEFASEVFDPRLLAAIRAYHAETVERLRDPEDVRFLPLLFATPDGGHDGVDWCCGFMWAIGLHDKAWAPLAKSRQGDLLLPLLAHEPEEFETGPPVMDDETTAFMRENALTVLTATVEGINRFWRNRERKAAGLPRLAPRELAASAVKAGRNDPCPCGSGLKFKKCCLAGADAS